MLAMKLGQNDKVRREKIFFLAWKTQGFYGSRNLLFHTFNVGGRGLALCAAQ